MSVITINIPTESPKFLPSFEFILSKASNLIVILKASLSDCVITLVTDCALVTADPTDSSVSISLIPLICVWFVVPKRGS